VLYLSEIARAPALAADRRCHAPGDRHLQAERENEGGRDAVEAEADGDGAAELARRRNHWSE